MSQSPIPLLYGDKIYMREYTEQDFEAWAALREISKSHLIPWEPTWEEDHLDKQNFLERISIYSKLTDNNSGLFLLIFRSEDEALIGGVSLTNVRWGMFHSGTLGYWIGQPYEGQGYMFAALSTFVPFVIHTLGVRRLEAACLPHNERSLKLLHQLGFQEEGLMRQHSQIQGAYQDHLLFAKLNTDSN